MGPGCFYPGNVQEFPDDNRGRSGFNGAGMFLSRKYGELDETDPSRLASMGPGCFYPGNAYGGGTPGGSRWLQWGRDVSIPEMHRAAGRQVVHDGFNGAGMFLSRKYGELDETDPSRLASMGPGCFYPGNAYGGGTPGGSRWLQW